ncbi:GTP-binding protein Rhes [Corythoichthys intestinalis]|uniref:GTP-binding protein Rhes n=1 Tax=Corythoichthys intestinalis TaxID=161448 RepID=UPI0025A5B0F7|nr:GTP-binding protein Rhes [Corythoichthys intestinalis]
MSTSEKLHFPVESLNTLTRHPHPSPDRQKHAKVSDLSKTGMGLLETVKGRWKQQDKVAPSTVKPQNCHRIVVLGAPGVGKTNMVRRFLGEEFQEEYEATTEDFHRKLFHVGGEMYQVDLLDAARERNFPAKRRLSILTGDIFLLVFSLDDKESFSEVRELLSEIRHAKSKLVKSKRKVRLPVVVCGNKSDLDSQRVISRSDITAALTRDVAFFETSAKRGTSLEAVFRELATIGGLPDETGPSQHRLVSMLTYQSLCRHGATPCATVDPLARRPSFGSDLRLVLGSSTKSKPERCQIQ